MRGPTHPRSVLRPASSGSECAGYIGPVEVDGRHARVVQWSTPPGVTAATLASVGTEIHCLADTH